MFRRSSVSDFSDALALQTAPSLPATHASEVDAFQSDAVLLSGQTFNQFVDFSNRIFRMPVNLKDVQFSGGVSFEGSTFEQPIVFENVIAGGISFARCRFLRSIICDASTAFRDADFRGATFHAATQFRCCFRGAVRFSHAGFDGSASFKSALFEGTAEFENVKFNNQADFECVCFSGPRARASFAKSRFQQIAVFERAVFSGAADFSDCAFLAGAVFSNVSFCLTEYSGEGAPGPDQDADFSRATFQASADGPVAVFSSATFGNLNVRRNATFRGARFRGSTGRHARRGMSLSFANCRCRGTLSLSEAAIENSNTDLSSCRVDGDLDLSRAVFTGDVLLNHVRVVQALNVAGAEFACFPDVKGAVLNVVRWDQSRLPANEAPRSSEHHILVADRLLHLIRLAREAHDDSTAQRLNIAYLKLDGGAAGRIYSLISDYGQSWIRPLLWIILLTGVIFPALFLAVPGNLTEQKTQERTEFSANMSCLGYVSGNSGVAAIELSVRNALPFVRNDMMYTRLTECLVEQPARGAMPGFVVYLLSMVQTGITFVLVALSILAVRNRMKHAR